MPGRTVSIEELILLNLLVAIQGLNVVRVRLSLDLAEEVGAVALEKGMLELDFFGGALALVEVVHIELAHKRVKIIVLEVGW